MVYNNSSIVVTAKFKELSSVWKFPFHRTKYKKDISSLDAEQVGLYMYLHIKSGLSHELG
jgi:hypothetical protein